MVARQQSCRFTDALQLAVMDQIWAPVPFGRLALPLLIQQLQHRDASCRLRALTSLCDLVHEPEWLYGLVNGGFFKDLHVVLKDEDPSVRAKTCELIHLVTNHSIGRLALLSSSLLPSLSDLLDDPSSSCRRNVHLVLNGLAQLPAGADAFLKLVPKLMLKLREMQQQEEEEEEVLLLSTLTSCSRLDPRPTLVSGGIPLMGQRLSHCSRDVRREAAAVLIALSVPEDGKRQVCEEQLLPVLMDLLQDGDVEVQTNAAGVIMNTVIITTGKRLSLELNAVPILLNLLAEEEEEEQRKRRKALILYCLRALTALAEAPEGRRLLQDQLPLLERRSVDQDQDIRRAAQTAIRVFTWNP
ncbi:radial spoke head 14 homolog [Cyprinodon tularosa]|uniref:radial spoke head 14 homolog n=1 Tax=Cyprinodon tularosa TaxID=77115 RepID=UPI0018E2691E|nr:radial spoke head 14 homolog [Cyprinodon tularosa]